jgi:hypothetical protein
VKYTHHDPRVKLSAWTQELGALGIVLFFPSLLDILKRSSNGLQVFTGDAKKVWFGCSPARFYARS